MSEFGERLRAHEVLQKNRRWVYVPYDQLNAEMGPLASTPARELGIVMLENPGKAARRPYHKQKLALLLANGRHFALEQAARGVAVRFEVAGDEGYAGKLERIAQELGGVTMMEAAERELRRELAPLVSSGCLRVVPHTGWLTRHEQFEAACPRPPFRMDAFYRRVRRDTGWLMDGSTPRGGKWSHDADNRKPWRGSPPAPLFPCFRPDSVTREVVSLVERQFAHHPGAIEASAMPATRDDAEQLWSWAKSSCLSHFGPYEDAMSRTSSSLFHTRVSALLNLQRLLPSTLVADVLSLKLPLASQEGFIRQLVFREYMHHVHTATDGFRELSRRKIPILDQPGDGGFGRWAGEPWPASATGDGGACPDALDATEPIPRAYWGAPSGMACLDHVVGDVWREAYSHHITRLMVLGNLATLIGVSPRELTDWFWVAYADAYDWVVEPNVLGMGSFATADLMMTKPYVSGAAYIDRMSDYCAACQFDPKRDCPVTAMYWAFLARNADKLSDNPRLAMPLRSLQRRAAPMRSRDSRVLRWVQETLREGKPLRREHLPE
jgi:deoxyribodipyrimidine photolyase-related protein